MLLQVIETERFLLRWFHHVTCNPTRPSVFNGKQRYVGRTWLLNDQGTRSTFSNSSSRKAAQTRPKKILFFGTDDFSLPTLKGIHEWVQYGSVQNQVVEKIGEDCEKQTVMGKLEVCTSQMKHLIQPVKVYAEQENLIVRPWPPDPSVIKREGFDLGVIASFGHLIPKKIIEAFPLGMLNVHASILPRWRGASPIIHAIMAGDKITGISIMEIEPHHFDIGQVIASESIQIGCDQTNEELTQILAKLGADLMVKVLKDLEFYRHNSLPQDKSKVCYAPVIDKSLYNIDWNCSTSRDVYNKSRALSGSGKLYSTWKDTDVKVMFSDCIKPDIVDALHIKLEDEIDVKPGRVVYVKTRQKNSTDDPPSNKNMETKRYLCVKCKSGWIAFANFYYGSHKIISALEYFNGYISRHRTRPQYFVHKNTYLS